MILLQEDEYEGFVDDEWMDETEESLGKKHNVFADTQVSVFVPYEEQACKRYMQWTAKYDTLIKDLKCNDQ